jgi:NAD-dependent DNA ligase
MLQQARDEAHRFAVTFNRKRRSMRTVTSELLSIPGIGPSKRRALLQTFGSVQGVRDATVEQIAALPGFSAESARRLLDSLAARAEGRPIAALTRAAASGPNAGGATNEPSSGEPRDALADVEHDPDVSDPAVDDSSPTSPPT